MSYTLTHEKATTPCWLQSRQSSVRSDSASSREEGSVRQLEIYQQVRPPRCAVIVDKCSSCVEPTACCTSDVRQTACTAGCLDAGHSWMQAPGDSAGRQRDAVDWQPVLAAMALSPKQKRAAHEARLALGETPL